MENVMFQTTKQYINDQLDPHSSQAIAIARAFRGPSGLAM